MRCCCLETLRGQPSEARQWSRAKGAARLTSLRPLRLRGAAGEQLELGLRTHPRVLQECPLSTVISRRVWHSGISASTRQSCENRLFFFVHTLACNSAMFGGPLRTKHPRVRGSAAQHGFAASSLIASPLRAVQKTQQISHRLHVFHSAARWRAYQKKDRLHLPAALAQQRSKIKRRRAATCLPCFLAQTVRVTFAISFRASYRFIGHSRARTRGSGLPLRLRALHIGLIIKLARRTRVVRRHPSAHLIQDHALGQLRQHPSAQCQSSHHTRHSSPL